MTNKMLEHVHIAETNLQTTEQSYIWKYGCKIFLRHEGQNGLVSTYRNVGGEILETGTRDYLWLLCVS